MKMFKFLVLISFFLAFTTTFVHAQDPDVVTDINGNELRPGARYFIVEAASVPTIPSAVGPDTPGCPSGRVVLDFNRKRPISITPVESNSTVILENTLVTVRFNYSYPCLMLISLVWKDGPRGFVTTGGVEKLNQFKITKHELTGGNNKYQLAACPLFECWGGCRCEPVGYVVQDGVRHLVAGGDPLTIVFVPVGERSIAYELPSM